MRGVIAQINSRKNEGVILGENGKRYPFDREDMVLYLDFANLTPNTPVRFDVEVGTGNAFNVVRAT
jgi:hypothetical protein